MDAGRAAGHFGLAGGFLASPGDAVKPTSMPTREWAAMTWEEARDLDPSRVVVLLPVGAVEAHGPHLPLDTDVVIAEAMACAGADRLAAAGLVPKILPSIAY